MKNVQQLGSRLAETIGRWRPAWSDVLRWAGYAGFILFVILPALLIAKIILKIVTLIVSW
jgi:hypothetical protein